MSYIRPKRIRPMSVDPIAYNRISTWKTGILRARAPDTVNCAAPSIRPVSQRIRSPRRCGPLRIDYASECGPTSADTVRHSGYDSTIENTTLSREMTIVDVRSTPCTTELGSSRTKINHDRGGSYTGLLQYIVRVSYDFNNHDRERGGYCNH